MVEMNNNSIPNSSSLCGGTILQAIVEKTPIRRRNIENEPHSRRKTSGSSGESFDNNRAFSTYSWSEDSLEMSNANSQILDFSPTDSTVPMKLNEVYDINVPYKITSTHDNDINSTQFSQKTAESNATMVPGTNPGYDLINSPGSYTSIDCPMPSTSHSVNSFFRFSPTSSTNKELIRESIDRELDGLDTCLPNLDFNKLEEKLVIAAKERQIMERKLLGEQV